MCCACGNLATLIVVHQSFEYIIHCTTKNSKFFFFSLYFPLPFVLWLLPCRFSRLNNENRADRLCKTCCASSIFFFCLSYGSKTAMLWGDYFLITQWTTHKCVKHICSFAIVLFMLVLFIRLWSFFLIHFQTFFITIKIIVARFSDVPITVIVIAIDKRKMENGQKKRKHYKHWNYLS